MYVQMCEELDMRNGAPLRSGGPILPFSIIVSRADLGYIHFGCYANEG